MIYPCMASSDSQLNRWNLLSFFYFIKQRDQIVNLWNYIWFSLKNLFVIIILRLILTFLITYFACPVWGNFFTVNVQNLSNNNIKTVVKMTNLEEFQYINNKNLISKTEVFNKVKNKKNVFIHNKNDKEQLCVNCEKILSLKNNVYYKNFIISFYMYGGFALENSYILFVNVTLLIALFIGYVFGFLPTNKHPGKLINTELSWWNPLSIAYGLIKRVTSDSWSSRIFWGLFYLINFINLGYNIYFYGKSVHSIMQTIVWLTTCYTWPRWYSSNLNKSY